MSINDKLLKAINNRGSKSEPFEYGILTADRWVLNLQDTVGYDVCCKQASQGSTSFNDILVKAAKTLTYNNKEMILEDKVQDSDLDGEDLPKNTLMVFRHILTSSNKDRDGDILRSEGMNVDPKMLLLWQHVHTLPIGKSIKVLRQDSKSIEMISAIVDMNKLCHDAAVMIDNEMGRFSHGFRALEFEEMKSDSGDFAGFDVTKAEIMEESLVSVPANVDAETQEVILSLVENGKLTSPIMKEYGKTLREKQNIVVPGITYAVSNGSNTVEFKGSTNDLEKVQQMGLVGGNKDEDDGKTKGTGCGEEKGAGDTGSPEETDVYKSEVKSGEDSELQEVKRFDGKLTGSWEMITKELESQTKRHMLGTNLDMGPDDWTYIVATFSDLVIVCVEKPQCGVPDEFRYFNIHWVLEDGKLKLTGDLQQVDIITSAEVQERLASLSRKNEVDKSAIIILTKSTEAQKRALVSQLGAMLPTKLTQDYQNLFSKIH